MRSKLGKGMMVVLAANIIHLLFNLISNLVLPKHLSYDAYAAIKTYQLYMAYVGIIHLGYSDGIYLRYGGKSINEINKSELAKSISVIRIYLLVAMAIGALVAHFTGNYILLIVFVSMLPTNMLSYFQFLFQASGEFPSYSKILNLITVCTFAVNMILVFALNVSAYSAYLWAYVAINIGIWLFAEYYFNKLTNCGIQLFYFSGKKFIENVKMGIFLTLGNFSSVLMTSMDRWFVTYFIDSIAFAQYSFAVTMEGFLNTAISPITVTLYNHFCLHDNQESNKVMRQRVMVFSAIIIAAAFPVKFILETYLKNYSSSSVVLFVLFGSQLFYIVIKGIYVNLFKARQQQSRYFRDLMIVIVFGFIANYCFYRIYPTKEAFAFATLLSSIFWYLMCQLHFRDGKIKEFLYLGIQILSFLTCGIMFNSIVGIVIYVLITVISTFVLMNDVGKWVIIIIRDNYRRILRNR